MDLPLIEVDVRPGETAPVSIFPGELFRPPRLWGERVYSRLFYWNEAAHGGHFAAFEQPAVFVEELRAAFRALPRGG